MEEYPRTVQEFEEKFASEQACIDYLFRIRWPAGFRCPRCGYERFWAMKRGLYRCNACDLQTSITAGTIFQDTSKPLKLWFQAMWYITNQKPGVSALGLQRVLGLGSYRTSWTWLHKLRCAMVRPGRDNLAGAVEVDETYIGGSKPGKRGRGLLEEFWCWSRPKRTGNGLDVFVFAASLMLLQRAWVKQSRKWWCRAV